jgi:isoaspartyl peptidase/L-asparaginase-like protein (Ntn-hydrolase superfamily)
MWNPWHRRVQRHSRSRPGRAGLRPAVALSLAIALVGLMVPLFPACRVRHLGGDSEPTASSSSSSAVIAASSTTPPSGSVPAGPASSASASSDLDAGPPAEPAVIALLGIDSEPEDVEAVLGAVGASRDAMATRTRGALDAVVDGMVVIEGSPSFIEAGRTDASEDALLTDAAVSGPDCWFAGVAALERVRNPVRAARALCGAPQSILAAGGAFTWARALGLTEQEPAPTASHSAAASATVPAGADAGPADASSPEWTPWAWLMGDPRRDGGANDGWSDADAESSEPRPPIGAAAILVRDATGAFAGAMSSASSDFGVPGRIGDVVIPGAALYVGDAGAVAISGYDGHLARLALARAVHARLAQHASAKDAAEWAIAQVPEGVHMGIIVLEPGGFAARSTTEMAWAAQIGDDASSSASKPVRARAPATSKGEGP